MRVRRLVVEADGGSRGNPGPAGYGALVRDPASGEVLAEVAEAIGTATNNVAEYSGLVAGLRAAVEIDPDCQVEVRMDSKLVVEQMSGRWQIKHEDMRRLASVARAVLPPDRVRYVWVPRERNRPADALANAAMDAAARGEQWHRESHSASAGSAPLAQGSMTSASGGSVSGGSVSASSASRAPSSTRAPRAADLGEPATLLLVRHGRTPLTEQGRFSGQGGEDPGLSAAGQADASRIAHLLAAAASRDGLLAEVQPASAVIASPLRRTRETATIIADTIGAPLRVDDRWTEASFGEWDGRTYAEIVKTWPAELAAWQGSTSVAPPGGESLDELRGRVTAAWQDTVRANAGRSVVVVTHVTPIRSVVADALAAAGPALWRMRISPCSLSVVRFWEDGNAEVLTVNHLP